jgi:predicted nucleic acid-binding protein
MIRAVYDCNVILSAIGWNGSARHCLKFVARRRVFLFVTDAILTKYESIIPQTLAEEMPEINPHPKFVWVRVKSRLVEPSPLGKRRSRDAKDDIYLACALGGCNSSATERAHQRSRGRLQAWALQIYERGFSLSTTMLFGGSV